MSEIQDGIAKTYDLLERGTHFIGVSVEKGSKAPLSHSGIVISSSDGIFVCHYLPAEGILIEKTGKRTEAKWFANTLTFKAARRDMADSFLARLYLIQEINNPEIDYGYFLPDARFIEDGTYKTKLEVPLLTTCVGFCLLVLDGLFYPEQYLNREEWSGETEESFAYTLTYKKLAKSSGKYPLAEMLPFIKRITPIEYFAASFVEGERKQEAVIGLMEAVKEATTA